MANQSLSVWLNHDAIKKKIADRLGQNAPAFTSALLNIYNSNPQLQYCDGRSILGAAFLSASLNLSIAPGLGQAYIVPFKSFDKETKREVYKATFQIGYKGFIQLALRSGLYERIHAGKVCEGEFKGFNPISGEPIIGEKISDNVVGYVAFFRMLNGFEKTLYMTKAEIEAHAEKYSQSYNSDKRYGKSSSPWSSNFDDMAIKTVLKKLLRSWGILSADLATAIQGDRSVVDRNTFTFPDGNVQNRTNIYLPDEQPAVNTDTGEVVEPVAEKVDEAAS